MGHHAEERGVTPCEQSEKEFSFDVLGGKGSQLPGSDTGSYKYLKAIRLPL